MIYGYGRVSSDAQDLTAQPDPLKAAKCNRVFQEKILPVMNPFMQ